MAAADLLEVDDVGQLFLVDAVGVVDEARRIRHGEHLAAKLTHLFRRVGRDVARSGYHRRLAFEAVADPLQHVLHHVDRAVAGGLGAD